MMSEQGGDFWLRLDNAAKIYPPVMNSEQTAVFRLTAELKERIRLEDLKLAVAAANERFPYMSVSLTRGLFWYFLEYSGRQPRIHADLGPICTPFASKRKGEPLFRIMVKERKLSVEFSHILTDGGGGMEYLKFLLAQYHNISLPVGITSDLEKETEDSYNLNFNPEIPPSPILSTAWHLPFQLHKRPRLHTMIAEMSPEELYQLAKKENTSVTAYLTAIYLFTLQEIFHEEKKKGFKSRRPIIRVQVPINLRKRYESSTMRNFSLFVTPEIDTRLGFYTFEEVLGIVHRYLEEHLQNKYINRIINRNVRSEKNPVIRILPLFVKVVALKMAYKRHGARKYSGVMTNLGIIDLPEDLKDYIEGFEIYPPPPNRILKVSCGVAAFEGKLRITFCSMTRSRRFEKGVINYLISKDIKVKIL